MLPPISPPASHPEPIPHPSPPPKPLKRMIGIQRRKLREAIATSQSRYGQADDADLHVCISHRRRRAIAHAKQKRLAQGKECVEIPEGDDPAFSCFQGTKLVGNSSTGRIVNGGRYAVTRIGGDKATLTNDLVGETLYSP